MRAPVIVACALVAGCSRPDVFAYDDFSYSADGWTIEGLSIGAVTLEKTFGNPPASICANDDANEFWSFLAPPSFTGDVSMYAGRALTWDATTTDARDPMLIGADGGSPDPLVGADGGLIPVPTVPIDAVTLTARGLTIATRPDFDRVAGTSWTPMTVTLDTTSQWHIVGQDGGAPATEEEIQRVLGAVTSLAIRGGWSNNMEQGCIDNIYFGTK